ncbi:hypothetical protein FIN92_01890 [Prevotella brunnea]|uniref:hypothetical protein n=1 Tax=Prevotella brunnea TaxID=2508867 RepID=UPI0028272BE5|nr:hypothetical protein [Prevotella brunnea]MDR0185348.1 hypothetical protein [Prevotella brunnea]
MGERSGYLGSDLRFQGIVLTIGLGGMEGAASCGSSTRRMVECGTMLAPSFHHNSVLWAKGF